MKILWKRVESAPQKQFLFFSTILFFTCYKIFMFRQRPDFLLRDKRLFKLSKVEITGVNCIPYISTCFISTTVIANQKETSHLEFDIMRVDCNYQIGVRPEISFW